MKGVIGRTRLACLAAALLAAPAFAQTLGVSMTEDVIPYGWLAYCAATKDPGCLKGTITPRDLALVSQSIAEGLTPVENLDPSTSWAPFPPGARGDCKNHVASTRQALIALGMDPKAMRFEGGELEDGSKHLVLIVTLAGTDYVLDMKTPGMAYPTTQRQYPWKRVAIEGERVAWER